MNIYEIFLIAVGLSMDAGAVSMTNGMCYKKIKLKHLLAIGTAFGVFQGIMPLIGYYTGSIFAKQVSAFDHWIALGLLAFIGVKMILDALEKDDACCSLKPFTLKLLIVQAIATSIDALAVGVSFAAMNVNIYISSSIIAVTTFILSCIAVVIGKKIGNKLNSKVEIFGGVILVLIGLKIFIEHMFM